MEPGVRAWSLRGAWCASAEPGSVVWLGFQRTKPGHWPQPTGTGCPVQLPHVWLFSRVLRPGSRPRDVPSARLGEPRWSRGRAPAPGGTCRSNALGLHGPAHPRAPPRKAKPHRSPCPQGPSGLHSHSLAWAPKFPKPGLTRALLWVLSLSPAPQPVPDTAQGLSGPRDASQPSVAHASAPAACTLTPQLRAEGRAGPATGGSEGARRSARLPCGAPWAAVLPPLC